MLVAYSIYAYSQDKAMLGRVGALITGTEDKAVGAAYKRALELWPRKEGYWGHTVDYIMLPDDVLREALGEETNDG